MSWVRNGWSRSLVFAVAGLLALQPTATSVASESNAESPTGALAVASDPPGAAVYVDGQLTGRTPVSLNRLTAGDHRVRVVKDGYLENGRVVSIGARRLASVQVKLTRHAGSGAASAHATPSSTRPTAAAQSGQASTPQTSDAGKAGSSRKKWLLIGAAAAGAGVAAYVLLQNHTPTAGTVTATPSTTFTGASVSFAVSGASDPDNKPLSYSWNFGDGESGSGATVSHIYTRAGTFNVVLTVSNGQASATASTTVTVRAPQPPVAGTVVVSPSIALVAAGVNLTAQGAGPGPDGRAVVGYDWNFGDATSGSGQSVSHAYGSAGTFNATVTVRDSLASATASATVTARAMTGVWRGSVACPSSTFNSVLTLTQSGAGVSGTYADQDGSGTVISGSISSSRSATITVKQGDFIPWMYSGTISADVNTYSGTVTNFCTLGDARSFTLTRQ
jgi:PKD repeat protein